MTALVLLNPKGGSADRTSVSKLDQVLRTAGVAADIVEIEGSDAAELARGAVAAGTDLVVAAGGDGTVSAVAGALAGSRARLGLIPLGTLNHFARDLGVPTDLDEACALLATGKPRTVDIARVNDCYFINNSAIGLYPLMVIDRDAQQQRFGRSKRLAMLVATVRALVRFRHHRLSLTIDDDERARVDTPLLFVGNNDYRLDLGQAGQRNSLSDGHLCVFVLGSSGRLGLLAAAIRALLGRTRAEDMIMLDDVRRLRVDSPRSLVAVALDGEARHLAPPLDFRICEGALTVIAP